MEQKGIKYNSRVYLQWEKKYKSDPVKTRLELRKINRYHKQYLYILTLTRNTHLINDIYDIMVDKFRADIYNNLNSNKISTIAKWLPREKSSYDKQLDFINKFTDKMYPGMQKNRAFRSYRVSVAELSKKLNITETFIAEKDYNNIDFRTVPVVCLRRNMNMFLAHNGTKDRLITYLNKKFVDVPEKTYIDYLLNENLHPVERQICISAFSVRKNNMLNISPFLNMIGNRHLVPILDMSSDVFKSGDIYHNILIALITLQFSDNIIINSKSPVLVNIYHKKNIAEKVKIIMRNLNESQHVDFNKIKELIKSDIFIISNKPTIGEYKGRVYYWPKRVLQNENLCYNVTKIKNINISYVYKILFCMVIGFFITFAKYYY